ncbi:hypothetical protein B0T16DRAFT_415420 [Cercophora newfieldiana]|uniref:Uncharacterized protein n=1 Tax=Cercophora newfieldiana TaxID=92897 RepID=A0AA39Y1I2_9PEZI|nr:hypothetical protein B0T16DRAFT_415420 [Cercophora newfieldiana]
MSPTAWNRPGSPFPPCQQDVFSNQNTTSSASNCRAMDGLRPSEELSDAANVNRVLKFLPANADGKAFAVDEILDPSGMSLVTVVRPRADDNEHDQRVVWEEKDWIELLRDHAPPVSHEKLGLLPHPNLRTSSKMLLVMFLPETEPLVPQGPTLLERQDSYSPSLPTSVHGSSNAVKPTAMARFYGVCRNVVTAVTSVLSKSPRKSSDEKRNNPMSGSEKDHVIPAPSSHISQKHRLRSVPFTSTLFRTITRRMSIHSWIIRLISRANVPAFERTLTEMPLYSWSGEKLGPQKAIIYNCRTSNEWEDDMALSVTHFPAKKLTFALLFGPSRIQQKKIISRLRRAGADTAHPMLLAGIFAELERGRQMEAVDDIINELEEQLTRIGQETVTSWQLSSQTKAERNRQKTEAWLNATFSKNILLANVALLYSMRRHLDEFQVTVNPALARVRRQQHPHQDDPNHLEYRDWRPETYQSHGSTLYSPEPHDYANRPPEYITGQETFTAEPNSIRDDEAKYHDALQQASIRMKDRLTSIIGEYDDKIRQCTMEVDGMAMATQWSHGETNMEIATASGEDSSQMRSIALVTMVFLPGTFFASMFSMTFFNWNAGSGDDGQPVVASSIWIYVLVTVVFTLVTLLLFWYFILSRQRNRKSRKQDIEAVR